MLLEGDCRSLPQLPCSQSFSLPSITVLTLKDASGDVKKPAGASPALKPLGEGAAKSEAAKVTVDIELEGIRERLVEVPADPGSYRSLATDGKHLYWLAIDAEVSAKSQLQSLEIARKQDGVSTVLADVDSYELSADGRKLLVRKPDVVCVFDAGAKAPEKLDKAKLPLTGWSFTFDPRVDWRQMFTEAWRLERDYFHDRGMNGVDWNAQRERFRPLAEAPAAHAALPGPVRPAVTRAPSAVRAWRCRLPQRALRELPLGVRVDAVVESGWFTCGHLKAFDPSPRPRCRSQPSPLRDHAP